MAKPRPAPAPAPVFGQAFADLGERLGLPPSEPGAASSPRLVRVRFEKSGRSGHPVTVLYDFEPQPSQEFLEDLAQRLRRQLGCGGTLASETVELQGDCRSRLEKPLLKLGMKAKGLNS